MIKPYMLMLVILGSLGLIYQPARAAERGIVKNSSAASVALTKSTAESTPQMVAEGQLTEAKIIAGPFYLHRKYRSMEGPYVMQSFRVADLAASRQIIIPESMVTFVEGTPAGAPSMSGEEMVAPQSSAGPIGLVDASHEPRQLYWFKGLKLIVLDEHDQPLPTAEFICHMNLDVNTKFRNKVFPDGEHNPNSRLMTLTQGQTEFHFPAGYAVPVASDEMWTFTLQAANRTSDEHRRVKHLLTLDFVKDSDLKKPVTALNWYTPYIAVIVDKQQASQQAETKHGPDCLGTSSGESASNMVPGSTIKKSDGTVLSGHWVIPPGTKTYQSPITEKNEPGFADHDRMIHAVWSHVHPLCTESSLVICDGTQRKKIFTAHVESKTKGGLELLHIEDILSEQGILLPAGQHYELEATYANDTNENQDSMVALGIFCEDKRFVKPSWPLTSITDSTEAASVRNAAAGDGKGGLYCGIKPDVDDAADTKAYAGTKRYPLFDVKADGPLLTGSKALEVATSAGNLRIVLDPSLAPIHATQLYKLLKSGAFNGTPMFRYEPNFVLQTAIAETKADGQPKISPELYDSLRRLPLEVTAQEHGMGLNKKWALSMGRYDASDSAVSSFSILLDDAPHLDHQYTVFGRVISDAASMETIEKIKREWIDRHPVITGVHEVPYSLVSVVDRPNQLEPR